MTTDIKEQEYPIYAYEIRKPNGSSELAYAAWFIKGYGKMMERYAYDPLVRLADITRPATHPAKTEQPSLSDERELFEAHIRSTTESVPPNNTWFLERSEAVPDMYYNQRYDDMWKGWQAAISAQRQDSDKDAG